MTVKTPERSQLSANNDQELQRRTEDTEALVHDIIGRNQEFFAEPANRVAFLQEQTGESMYALTQYVNAKLRGEKPHQLRHDPEEKGAYLMALHTPAAEDKPAAFESGYKALQDYLAASEDDEQKKLEGAAMALEALTIWVHPFNDGNGRTSRFLGKLMEDGAQDMAALVAETVSNQNRGRIYTDTYASKESVLKAADNPEVMMDDDERIAERQRARTLPGDVTVMYYNVKHLLENQGARKRTKRYTRAQ